MADSVPNVGLGPRLAPAFDWQYARARNCLNQIFRNTPESNTKNIGLRSKFSLRPACGTRRPAEKSEKANRQTDLAAWTFRPPLICCWHLTLPLGAVT